MGLGLPDISIESHRATDGILWSVFDLRRGRAIIRLIPALTQRHIRKNESSATGSPNVKQTDRGHRARGAGKEN
jgi:hypothetical protein